MAIGLKPARAPIADAQSWNENRPSSGWFPRLRLGEVWRYRELVAALAARDLRLRYRQTFFGVAWAVIQPLAGAAIFAVVFGRLAGLPSDGIPYAVFVYAGLILWTYVANGVTSAAQSLAGNRALITKVYFPRLAAPIAAILPGLLDLGISLVVLALLMAAEGVTPTAAMATLPLWLLAAGAVALGAGLFLSALNVRYRDVQYALPFLVQTWLFVTPVVYPSSLFDDWSRYLFALNPLVGVVDGFRWSLVAGPAPGADGLVSLAAGVLLLAGGLLYFRKVERTFADVV
jgi:lipopolysaccharide transport system permease protein